MPKATCPQLDKLAPQSPPPRLPDFLPFPVSPGRTQSNKSPSILRHRHAPKLGPGNQPLLQNVCSAFHRLVGSCKAAVTVQVTVDAKDDALGEKRALLSDVSVAPCHLGARELSVGVFGWDAIFDDVVRGVDHG